MLSLHSHTKGPNNHEMKIAVAAVAAALCALAAAGTVGATCDNPVDLIMNELYEGNTIGIEPTAISCMRYKYKATGLWYHFKGDGQAVMLDTCDQQTTMDTVIFVFTSCDQTGGFIDQCYTMDDDGCNQQQSRVTFVTNETQDYYVFVAGYRNETGIFRLATSIVQPPTNYQCHTAVDVPESYPYSVVGETGTCLPVEDRCQNTRSSGLWYKVKGSGQTFLAHTCSLNTNFDSVIGVFASCTEEAGADGCITHNNDACYTASLVSWRSVMNSEYWILVTGFRNARGTFTLAIEQRSLHPYSRCNESITITKLPFYYSGQTDYLDTSYSECRGMGNQHAVYFRLQGGGNRKIVATTCTSASTVDDTLIEVYRECNVEDNNATHCVAYNDDYCHLGAQVVFLATNDVYYIAVASYSPTVEGINYSLAVLPYEEINNTECWYAQEVTSLPDDFVGNTMNRATTTQSCDGTKVERRGAWYRYTHTEDDATMSASTCNRQNIMNSRIEVYHDCNDMQCVAVADPSNETNCTKVTFLAERDQTYNIFITAADPNDPGSYFHVDFYREEANNHSKCTNPYFVNRGQLPYRLQDNTMLAEPSFSSCTNTTMRGIWVSVIGTGNKIVATTCDTHTGIDTVLELYDRCPEEQGPGEGCLEVNDDMPSCGRASEIEFATEPGAYYWLFVYGFGADAGIFVLNLYEKVPLINSQCHNAVGIHQLPYYDYGLTTYSDMCNASCSKRMRKGNWYEFIGDGHWVTLSTCNLETTFATEIEVYLACSEYGGEICVNHNHDYKCSPKTEITFAAIKDQLFYIFITGVDEAVMSEGFFGLTVTRGAELPVAQSSSSEVEVGMSGFGKFMVATAVVACCGVVGAIVAVVYGIYKKRHLAYQEITTGTTATSG